MAKGEVLVIDVVGLEVVSTRLEAKPSAGLISNESPVGKALLGHKVGDVVIVSTPGGVKELTILTIN